MVAIDVVVLDMVVDMIDDHVLFGMYQRLDFDHQFEENPFKGVTPPYCLDTYIA